MANEEDVARLRQGIVAWNMWRQEHPHVVPDLRDAFLPLADLAAVDLSATGIYRAQLTGAYLYSAKLYGANLRGADLRRACLDGAKLCRAHVIKADLSEANLRKADLSGADLSEANLSKANLREANLSKANLREADLSGANLMSANLDGAEFAEVTIYETLFVTVDLSATKGLETCQHLGPSIVDYQTLQQSDRLPLAFLRGCGLPDRLIDSLPSLLEEAIQYYSCFISYSSKDDAFAKRLHADLQNNGVRCWFAPHDLPIGAKTWDAIDAAITMRDKVLLILSKNAIASDWVENEVSKAFAEERRRRQVVLFPVRIDQAVMNAEEPWAAMLRDQRNIGDFRRWKEHDAYQQAFDRVLRDLKAVPQVIPSQGCS